MTTLYVELPVPRSTNKAYVSLALSKVREMLGRLDMVPYALYADKTVPVIRVYIATGRDAREVYHAIVKPLHLLLTNEVIDLHYGDPEGLFVHTWMVLDIDALYVVFSEKSLSFKSYIGSRK